MILVTGGNGYIGSHICLELIQSGFDVIVLDNFSNSAPHALAGITEMTGQKLHVVEGDVRDAHRLRQLFRQQQFTAVIHLAGHKIPAASLTNPLTYFDNNVNGTITLCRVMAEFACKNLVFSSSASVYANASGTAVTEQSATLATTPYARSKLIAEEVLHSLSASDHDWRISILRYFNPTGAHVSGLIGENPKQAGGNLMPSIIRVASSQQHILNVFGNDYDTRDGTTIRDYIHVQDLAAAHSMALGQLLKAQGGIDTYNIGTGKDYSVLEVIAAFESATGCHIPYQMTDRRPNEIAFSLADPSLANRKLHWQAAFDIQQMCLDSWVWASRQRG